MRHEIGDLRQEIREVEELGRHTCTVCHVSSAMLDAIVTSVTPPKKGRKVQDNQSLVHAVAVRTNMQSILVAMMKSFSCSPLTGLQRDRRIASTKADIRMMAFCFREFTNLLNKGKRLPQIAKPEAPLDAVSFLSQLPVRGLCVKELSLLAREWRYSPVPSENSIR